MVELMLNMYVCSILSHDVSKFVCFISQLRFLITVKSCNVKGFYINNIKNQINECLKDKVCGGEISMERKELSTSEVAQIGAELASFKGVICGRAEILGAVLAL